MLQVFTKTLQARRSVNCATALLNHQEQARRVFVNRVFLCSQILQRGIVQNAKLALSRKALPRQTAHPAQKGNFRHMTENPCVTHVLLTLIPVPWPERHIAIVFAIQGSVGEAISMPHETLDIVRSRRILLHACRIAQ